MRKHTAILRDRDMMVLGTIGRFQNDPEQLTIKVIKAYLPISIDEVLVSIGYLIEQKLVSAKESSSIVSFKLTSKGNQTFEAFSEQGVI